MNRIRTMYFKQIPFGNTKRRPLLIMKVFFYVLSILALTAVAQDAAMPEIVRQYMQQQNIGSSKAQQMLDEYRGKSKKAGTPDLSKPAESGSARDTTAPESEMSVYEDIIRGVSIEPDDLLDSLEIFGHNVFDKMKPSAFASDDYISIPASYPVNVGDEVVIMMWGRINEEHTIRVDRDGKINIPHVGPILVAGLPFSAMQKNIIDRVQSIEGVKASVTMGELRAIQIFCMGEVASPGMYTVGALTNVTNALFAAGGPTKNGSLRHIELRRNGRRIKKLDFYDFLLSGNNYTNIRLKSGDVVFVPMVKKMAAVAGNVRKSALYEIESNTSLKDLIGLAGGITPAAWTNRIQVERFKNNQFQVVLDLDAGPETELPDFSIRDGDIVKIFPIIFKDHNAIFLSGNVLRPGKYEFSDGMRISDVIHSYGQLKPGTYFDYAVVKRFVPPSFQEMLIPFSLAQMLEDKSDENNIALQPKDEIFIFNRDFFEPVRIVSIGGAVTNPDDYQLLENMTIRDLIVQAGGLSDNASPERGELYRRGFINDNVITEKITFNVNAAMNNDPEHNYTLKKSDRIFVRRKKGWEKEKTAVLSGEFVYPGTYVLLEGETLDELIARAGGFSKEAYLSAAVFTRENVQKREKNRINEYARNLEMDIMKLSGEMASKEKAAEGRALLQQQLSMLEKLRMIQPIGRVVIDLTNPANYDQFLLEDGDSLHIPKDISTVTVLGEVFNPATFKLDGSDKIAGDFIQTAGGFKEHADKRNTYIIKANGTVLTRKMVNMKRYTLEPGDAVVVPQRIKYTSGFKVFSETISTFVNITAVTTSIATLIILIQNK
ncbi:MAG: hypothetical protein GF350_13000 [Chitinivibrionales bacterium]|nr:hypothetical protein [Chitinivibrionales bacterium]